MEEKPTTQQRFFLISCVESILQNDILNLNIIINWLVLMDISTVQHPFVFHSVNINNDEALPENEKKQPQR